MLPACRQNFSEVAGSTNVGQTWLKCWPSWLYLLVARFKYQQRCHLSWLSVFVDIRNPTRLMLRWYLSLNKNRCFPYPLQFNVRGWIVCPFECYLPQIPTISYKKQYIIVFHLWHHMFLHWSGIKSKLYDLRRTSSFALSLVEILSSYLLI